MRKKTACFLAAMLFTTSMYAMKEITGEFQPWDGNSVVNGNTLNFLGDWNGMTFKFFDDEGCVYEGGLDLSGYDVIVLKMSDTSCMFKMKVEYTDGTKQQDSWGTEAAAQPGALIAAVPLNSAHKDMVKDFFIQNAKYPGTITIDKIYACTSAEYAQLLAENKATKFNLTLKKIEEGGGSSYNPNTHTITIESDGSHRGWYFDSEYRDFSAFKSFVADFQTSSAGELCVEYDDNTSTSAPFEAGTPNVSVTLGSGKNKLRQVYVKGNAGATYVLKEAYFSSEGPVTGISGYQSVQNDQGTEYYSLDGKRQTVPKRGIMIQKKNGVTKKIAR